MPSDAPRRTDPRPLALAVNGGSSSLKFALFALGGGDPEPLGSGKIERLGGPDAAVSTRTPGGPRSDPRPVGAGDHDAAAAVVTGWLRDVTGDTRLAAVGHRFVHGGPTHFDPERITPALRDDLRALGGVDPDHMPAEVALAEALGRALPGVPQVACFDTRFARDLPRVARLVPIPRRYEAKGVRRYGFHGLSYEFLTGELREAGAAGGRVVLAHLGSGASLAAVKDGRPVDTSMGLTPTAGTVMGTRPGDLDPGLAAYLAAADGLTAEGFQAMVNRESGLLGVSETSGDLRDLLKSRDHDPRAAEAVDLFCYSARKWVGAFAAALGGLDTLVFAGGIGENSHEARAGVCRGLEFLGVALDPSANEARSDGPRVISAGGSAVTVRVIPTDEELTIARALAPFATARG